MKQIRKFSVIFFGAFAMILSHPSYAASSSQCEMCKYIFNEAIDVSQTIITYDQFTYAMEIRCSQLAALIQNQCKNMLQDYGEMMYELSDGSATPEEGCQQIALCDGGSTPCTCTSSSSSANITGGTRTTVKYSGCTNCPATTYSCSCNTDYAVQNQGTSSCSCSVYCSAGKYYNNGSCTVCASGTYKESAGNTSCTACPSSGKTTGTTAAAHDSVNDCYLDNGSDTAGVYDYNPVCYYK